TGRDERIRKDRELARPADELVLLGGQVLEARRQRAAPRAGSVDRRDGNDSAHRFAEGAALRPRTPRTMATAHCHAPAEPGSHSRVALRADAHCGVGALSGRAPVEVVLDKLESSNMALFPCHSVTASRSRCLYT